MTIKEEDAKKTICQETFSVPAFFIHDGHGIREHGPWTCIGSECMAWRWVKSHGNAAAIGYGYCGKAGRPEDLNEDAGTKRE